MTRNILTVLIVSSLTLVSVSCSSLSKAETQSTKKTTIISSFYSPVVRGANAPKGMRIGVTAVSPKGTSFDSLTYEGFTKEVDIITTSQDTVWMEAYFYPSKDASQPESEPIFSANNSVLHYTLNNQTSSIKVRNMVLISNPTQWE